MELLTVAEAQKMLKISQRTIMRRIDSGDWKEGVHWFDLRSINGINRVIRINLEAVEKLYSIPAPQRSAKRFSSAKKAEIARGNGTNSKQRRDKMETSPQQPRRIAINHLGEKTISYINHLEAVAEAAKQVTTDPNFESIDGSSELKFALQKLEDFVATVANRGEEGSQKSN